jgi:hypothetical protein
MVQSMGMSQLDTLSLGSEALSANLDRSERCSNPFCGLSIDSKKDTFLDLGAILKKAMTGTKTGVLAGVLK